MEVLCTGKKKIILFFIYFHDKFLTLSLLNPLEKNPGVVTAPYQFSLSVVAHRYVYRFMF